MDSFVALVAGLTRARDPRLMRIGDTVAVRSHLVEVASRTRSSVWNLQRELTVSTNRAAHRLNEATRTAGLEERVVVPPVATTHNPLLSSLHPQVRFHSVRRLLLVTDRREIVVSGPDALDDGSSPGWWSHDAGVVAHAVRAFDEVWRAARTSAELGLRPPLPARRCDIALALLEGLTDQEVAADLGISGRTVSQEVRAIVDWLGARNRTHAVAMLVGAA